MRRSSFSRNHYFVFGLLLGLVLSFYIPQDIWELECPQEVEELSLIEKFGHDFEPHLNIVDKPLQAKKPVKNVIRPRYYSSELGIREKIFIGVMTSQDNINTLATAINRTAAHLVNKMKFFINADNVKTNYKLKNIVGFTDPRENLRPFHVIKYIADNYLDDYDYFLIIPDTVYVDGRKLKRILYHISITFDLYMGSIYTPQDDNYASGVDALKRRQDAAAAGGGADVGADNDAFAIDNDDFKMLSDRNYCDLNAGIVLSSSVIRKMRNNLDWCVRNGITNVHSVNIGRCVKYSSKIAGCQESFQSIQQRTFSINPFIKLYKDLNILAKDEAFRNATTVYPITNTDDFYILHAYYSKHHLELVQQHSYELEQKAYRIANGSISNNILEIRWPLGVPLASTPETRHDIITWHLINRTHIFLPNADNIVEPLRRVDSMDFKNILDVTLQYAAHKYPQLEFLNIHTAYRKFDATRGMDYQLHLNFRNRRRAIDDVIIKSFQAVKPLGRVEVVPSPYVTESTRIAILVPTFEHQLNDAMDFIIDYEHICMRNQDNTFLLMIFLYRYDSPSKGDEDPFKSIKTIALDLSSKYKNDGSRIAWVSIRLPTIYSDINISEDIMLTSLYGRNEILSVAVADLALPKIGLDSLVLMASTSIKFKTDFLNRVRMNTIQGFQIYAPIGFMMYPCKLAFFCKECESCDVSQTTGYFDKANYDVISFYSRDYVQARKLVEISLPIMRNDIDIDQLPMRGNKQIENILDMFVVSQHAIHILRGAEPNLRFGNAIRNYLELNNNQIPKCHLANNLNSLPPANVDDVANRLPSNYNNNNNYNDNIHSISSLSSLSSNNQIKSSNPSSSVSGSSSSGTSSSSSGSHSLASSRLSKCIHLASRKQMGDAILRFEDKSILQK